MWTPIYEWRWERDGYAIHITRSTRTAHAYQRFAAKLGGEVVREQVGLRLNARISREINKVIAIKVPT